MIDLRKKSSNRPAPAKPIALFQLPASPLCIIQQGIRWVHFDNVRDAIFWRFCHSGPVWIETIEEKKTRTPFGAVFWTRPRASVVLKF